MLNHQQANERRDHKIKRQMNGIAPLWLQNDVWRPEEESFLFDLVYQHSIYGWIRQRFKYDGFNDVLYHMGQFQITETESLQVQDAAPYIEGDSTFAIPNNPKPRQ